MNITVKVNRTQHFPPNTIIKHHKTHNDQESGQDATIYSVPGDKFLVKGLRQSSQEHLTNSIYINTWHTLHQLKTLVPSQLPAVL